MLKYILQWVEENYNYYDLEPVLLNYSIKSKNIFGYGINKGIIFGKDFHAEFYISEKDLKAEAENWYNFFINKEKFKLFVDSINSSSKDVWQEIKNLSLIDLSNLNNKELWKLYSWFGLKLSKLYSCYDATQPYRLAKLEKELLYFFKKNKVKDPAYYFSVVTSPNKKIIFSKKWKLFFGSSFAELISKEDSNIDREIINQKMYSEKKAYCHEKDNVLSNLNPSSNTRNIINILSIISYERFKMRFVWMSALYYNELFLIELKQRYKIKKSDLRAYDFKEIKELIIFGKKISPDKISSRKKGFLKHLINGKIKTYEGIKAVEILDSLVKKKEEVKELKGTIASKGYSVGKAVILSYCHSEEHSVKIKNMKKGDIIITEMTRPNILTACKNAGAIVTDEGGITCHAAIIAREMKKPCIIGTKIATKVFKDGDLVEVDANKGVVKKLKWLK